MNDNKHNIKSEFSVNKSKFNQELFQNQISLENIGKAIKEVRLKRGITLQDFSHYTGVAIKTLSKLENNKINDVKLTTIIRIFERLNAKIFFQIELQRAWKEFNEEQKREQKKLKKTKK